jgi:chemotaxis family two-component system sensor kinase Cph1
MRPTTDEPEEMQRFLDHAVHDLRAVVRRIGIRVELLQEERDGDEAFREIMQGVRRSTAILDGISQYSTALRAADNSFTKLKVEIALNAALRGMEKQIRESGARITHGALPEVVSDPERLTELFRILISNALTYRSAEAPKVEIGARAGSDEWILSVRDNGIGIAPRYQERVFDPFYRLHGSEIPGVGLGLAIGRKLLETHRGRIWVESEAGAGATFYFALPAGRREMGEMGLDVPGA